MKTVLLDGQMATANSSPMAVPIMASRKRMELSSPPLLVFFCFMGASCALSLDPDPSEPAPKVRIRIEREQAEEPLPGPLEPPQTARPAPPYRWREDVLTATVPE